MKIGDWGCPVDGCKLARLKHAGGGRISVRQRAAGTAGAAFLCEGQVTGGSLGLRSGCVCG